MVQKTKMQLVAFVMVAVLVLSQLCPVSADAAKKVSLNRKKVTLYIGKSFQLKIRGTKKKVQWKTSSKKIATVSRKGKVKAKKKGTAKITAKVAGKKLVCKVTVKKGKSPDKTEQPQVSSEPVMTQGSSAGPAGSQNPGTSGQPGGSQKPDQSPAGSQAPAGSQSPGTSGQPDGSQKPDQSPTGSQAPAGSQNPGTSGQPGESQKPEESSQPPMISMEPYESGKPVTPVLSNATGVYGTGFQLEIGYQPGTKVYYTTDGSIPTEDSTLYTNGIEVKNRNGLPNVLSAAKNIKKMYISGSNYDYVPQSDEVAKCTVIRAVAVSPDHEASDVVTASYFVGNDVKTKYAGAAVMSLVIDPDSLLNDETGIHVLGNKYKEWKNTDAGKAIDGTPQYWSYVGNYTQKGREWERQANIDFIDADSENLEFSAPVGIRLHGGASRMYGQKSFNFYLREEYGQKNLKYPLIPGDVDAKGKQIKKYKSFMLRNGGNDTEYTKIRDVFNQEMVSDRAFGVQAVRPCVLFINGEYWGLYNLTEKYSDKSIEENYGVVDDNVVVFKEGELDEGQDGDEALYEELQSFADKDFTDESVYEEFCQIMDIDSFADYYATEIYIANQDWGPGKNYELWRARDVDAENPYADGKWRYLLFDTEYSMGLYGGTNASTKSFTNAITKDALFAAVMKNTEFRQKFLTAIEEIGSVNFNYDTCAQKLDEYTSTYQPLMQDFYTRFYGKDTWNRMQFDSNINTVKNFLRDRYSNIINEVETWYKAQ